MAADYELNMDTLREMLKRAKKGEDPERLIGEFFWEQVVVDDLPEDGFGCCNGGPCNCK